ncbi:hypothetical protein GCM10025857_08550 [Alicyclobacillus contaminans]|nr:hypothetical protein GCM10025857_08550 [Alicyclobacillus contaminans]
MSATAAKALLPELEFEEEPVSSPPVMEWLWRRLWAISPWLETCGETAFWLQIPGTQPPFREVRQLLLDVERAFHGEQRVRVGLAESPFLARALVEWGRWERVPQARCFRIGRQLWLVSPGLANGPLGRPDVRTGAAADGRWAKPLPIRALWTLAEDKREALERLGIFRLGQLERVPATRLRRHFGKEALEWFRWLEPTTGGIRVNYPRPQHGRSWQAVLGEEAALEQRWEIVQSLIRDLTATLEQAMCGALRARLEWESDAGEGRYERAVQRPLHTPEAWLAAVEPGMNACRGRILRRLAVYAEELRPLQTVQTSWLDCRGMAWEQTRRKRSLERWMEQINRRYPRMLQWGIKPTFREQRLQALHRALEEAAPQRN